MSSIVKVVVIIAAASVPPVMYSFESVAANASYYAVDYY